MTCAVSCLFLACGPSFLRREGTSYFMGAHEETEAGLQKKILREFYWTYNII